jgi:DNA-binding CsgD family transcriptional regulator
VVLVGRDRERRQLEQMLATARSGRSGVLAIVGEAGIGKTTLLEAAAAAGGGMRILRARGIESEGQVPFGGLLELLRPALGAVERVPRPQAAALEGAFALRPARARDRFAVGAATLSLLAAFAEEGPVLALVDDAHWLDEPSAEALLFAVRRLLADPIAVVLAVRDGHPSLLDGADVPTLRLEGLDREAAGRLLGGVSVAAADRLFGETGGNPLALVELAPDAERVAGAPPEHPLPISTSIARAFLRRTTALPEETRRALLLAATSHDGDLAVLARGGLAVGDLAAAEEAGLVRIGGGAVEFRHPLARSSVYAEAPPDERRAAHRALAAALPDRDLDRRAWHLASAATGPDRAASSALEGAARRARERAGYAVAASGFEHAARLEPEDARRGDLLYEAAEAAWLAGRPEQARALLDEAARRSSRPQVDSLRGEIATRRGPVLEGYELLVSAAARAEPADAVLMLAEAADACFYSGDPERMLAAAERADALLHGDHDTPARFYAATARGAARVLAGLDGAADLRRAVALYHDGDFADDPRTLAWAAFAPLFLRDAESGRELIAHAIAVAREHAAVGALPRLLNRLARDEAMTDRWADARAHFHETIRLARETGQRTELAAALAGLSWLEARAGNEAARALGEEGRVLCRELGVGFYELWTYTALGELELGLGRPVEAAEHLERHESRAAELGLADVDMSAAPELVEAYLRVGQTAAAEAAASGYERRARAKAQPWALARAARCRGLLADEFEEPFEEALRLHAQTPDTFESARTRLAYGARLRRARQRVRAREQLRAAHEAFERLGPSPWVEVAAAELAATGETARRRDGSMLADLTPQELQIARLLTGGKTTREAAAALFLSPKTIEYHLRSVYRKLGLNSREALAQALGAQRGV